MDNPLNFRYLTYALVFGILGLTITSSVYMAGNDANNSELTLINNEDVIQETGDFFLTVEDVDPMNETEPTLSRVGNTLRAEWALETESEFSSILYSLDAGYSWTEISNQMSTSGSTLFQVPETDADNILVKVETVDASFTSQVDLVKQVEALVDIKSKKRK
ncbi:MAG: hypothetical protein ABH826_02490 [Patescibacteria group bacterium]